MNRLLRPVIVAALGTAASGSVAHANVEIGGTAGLHVFSDTNELGVPDVKNAPSERNSALFGLRIGVSFNDMFGIEGEFGVIPSEARTGVFDVWNLTYRAHVIAQFGAQDPLKKLIPVRPRRRRRDVGRRQQDEGRDQQGHRRRALRRRRREVSRRQRLGPARRRAHAVPAELVGQRPDGRLRGAASASTRSSAARTPRSRSRSRRVRRTPTATASRTTRTSARTSPRTRTASRTTTAAPIRTTTATASPTRSDKCPMRARGQGRLPGRRRLPRSGQRQRRHPGRRRQVPERGRGQGRLPGRRRLPRSGQRQRRRARRRRTSARTSRRPRTATRTTTAAPTRCRPR